EEASHRRADARRRTTGHAGARRRTRLDLGCGTKRKGPLVGPFLFKLLLLHGFLSRAMAEQSAGDDARILAAFADGVVGDGIDEAEEHAYTNEDINHGEYLAGFR